MAGRSSSANCDGHKFPAIVVTKWCSSLTPLVSVTIGRSLSDTFTGRRYDPHHCAVGASASFAANGKFLKSAILDRLFPPPKNLLNDVARFMRALMLKPSADCTLLVASALPTASIAGVDFLEPM
jgi:hypothetical protein